MWSPLAAITRSDQARNLPIKKPFLISRFTEALSYSTLLWRDLQAFSSMCVHKPKSKGSSLATMRAEIFELKSHVVVQQVPHSLCRKCRGSFLLEDAVGFLGDLLSPWKNYFRLQIFFGNGKGSNLTRRIFFETKLKSSSPSSMLRRQAYWLRLHAWLLKFCDVQRHHSQTLRSDHSVF